MAEFVDADLRGALFVRTDLREVDVRGAMLHGARFRGVELCDVRIDGELRNVVVNGVDIAPLVEAELDRRMPERPKMRPTDADGYREAWSILERLWGETVERARALSPAALHESVDGEWSFVETLRHLSFATAAWVGRMLLGDPDPYHPLDLPWDEAPPEWDFLPRDREARPTLDEVLALRAERWAMVATVLDDLTDEQLTSKVSDTTPGWPLYEGVPFALCLDTVLNEEWHHRLYAERDLTVLTGTA